MSLYPLSLPMALPQLLALSDAQLSAIMAEVELVRARHRPERITTLFVGESPPHRGGFFYCGGCNLLRRFQSAAGFVGTDEQFLAEFRARGWFLDDLCLEPVDHLKDRSERERKWRQAQAGLVERIREYQPLAVVSILLGIAPVVREAASSAGCGAPTYAVPFPNQWHTPRFQQEMARILPLLPTEIGRREGRTAI